MEKKAEVSLLQAMILLQGAVLSCIDRKRFSFTRTQQNVMTVLAMEGELTMKQVSRYIAASQEQTTRAVAPLADAGYVERRTDPANRTRVFIGLTEQGRELLKEYWDMVTENLSLRLRESLGEEDRTALYEAAGNIIEIMEKMRA